MTLRQRPGDQPLPEKNNLPHAQDELIKLIEQRRDLGISRYGTALQPHNGRDTLRDALEEALDLSVYLMNLILERDNPQ